MNVLEGKLVGANGTIMIFTLMKETFRLNFEERPDLKEQCEKWVGNPVKIKGESNLPGWFKVAEVEFLPAS